MEQTKKNQNVKLINTYHTYQTTKRFHHLSLNERFLPPPRASFLLLSVKESHSHSKKRKTVLIFACPHIRTHSELARRKKGGERARKEKGGGASSSPNSLARSTTRASMRMYPSFFRQTQQVSGWLKMLGACLVKNTGRSAAGVLNQTRAQLPTTGGQ